MTIIIPPEFEGRTLRSYLKFTLMLSTAVIAKLKNHERGMVVGGERVTVRYVLHAGDVLEIADRDTAENATETVIPVELPLEILYEDEHVIALNKPADMPTHPSHGHLGDTLANALAYRYESQGEPFVFRPLGRLDRNTSGVVVTAKTRAVSGTLSQALRRGNVRKRYLAILDGHLPVDGKTHNIIAHIHRPRAEVGSILRVVCPEGTEGADHAHTRYRVLAASDTHSLVLAEPVTGRTHQLRVHFSHIGHPIMGDELYGHVSDRIGRHALHALSLSVPLPFTRAMGASAASGAEMRELDPRHPLNAPTPDGYLHTWAPLPTDMEVLVRELFSNEFTLPRNPTVGDLNGL